MSFYPLLARIFQHDFLNVRRLLWINRRTHENKRATHLLPATPLQGTAMPVVNYTVEQRLAAYPG